MQIHPGQGHKLDSLMVHLVAFYDMQDHSSTYSQVCPRYRANDNYSTVYISYLKYSTILLLCDCDITRIVLLDFICNMKRADIILIRPKEKQNNPHGTSANKVRCLFAS